MEITSLDLNNNYPGTFGYDSLESDKSASAATFLIWQFNPTASRAQKNQNPLEAGVEWAFRIQLFVVLHPGQAPRCMAALGVPTTFDTLLDGKVECSFCLSCLFVSPMASFFHKLLLGGLILPDPPKSYCDIKRNIP
jgi:hypothetical protein